MSMSTQPEECSSERSPQRILLVDDDDLELELMADRLASLGFQTHTAANGSEALALLQSQSFPVVITDWRMPDMDGIQLTEQLRAQGDNETYIIMLTVLDDGASHERGYFAGVDDYLSKRAPDAKIIASVRAAFKAVELRQALRVARQQQATTSMSDIGSGMLADRLRAEVKRAARYHRHLALLVMQLDADEGKLPNDTMARATLMVGDVVRVDIDFVSRYRSVDGMQRIAVILPETDRAEAVAIGGRLCGELAHALQSPLDSFVVRVGCASFTPGVEVQAPEQVAANVQALLREAEAAVRVAPLPAKRVAHTEAH